MPFEQGSTQKIEGEIILLLNIAFTNIEKGYTWNINRREVKVMAQDVLCEVNNCVYNEKGNRCGASQIYVVSNTGNKADSSDETDCKTFKRQ